MRDAPNPGSKEAIKLGCTCPVIDNHYGRGFGEPVRFWINGECRVHIGKLPSESEASDA